MLNLEHMLIELRWETGIYHSIKLPFDAEVAEKLLNGI